MRSGDIIKPLAMIVDNYSAAAEQKRRVQLRCDPYKITCILGSEQSRLTKATTP